MTVLRPLHRLALLGALLIVPACSGSGAAPATSATPAAAAPPATGARTAPAPAEASASSTAAGAFTTAQATRGDEVFAASCADCHGMRDVRGSDFMFNWEGSSVGRLYREISRTMPEDAPGSLPTEDYLAVVAYILSLNEFPAGETALTSDPERLDALRIER